MRLVYIFSLIVLILSSSCDKGEDNNFYLLVSPFDLYFYAKPNEVVIFRIEASTEKTFDHFTVSNRIINETSKIILDSNLIDKNKFKYSFEYKVPDLIEETEIELVFSIYDIDGDVIQVSRNLLVRTKDRYLTETAGHQMYSAFSNGADAYNLHEGIPLYSEIADSAKIDIKDVSDTVTLSRKWVSQTNVKFIRYNGFDYANSTLGSLKKSVESGVKLDFIDQLQENDIILLQLDNMDTDSSYAVIQITQILDQEGSVNDRYIFSLKK